MKKKIQAVIFDLDGVLADTRMLHFEALSMALNDLGFTLSLEEHEEIYDGLPTFRKVELLTEKLKLNDEQIKFLNQKKQEYTTQLLVGRISPNSEHSLIFDFLKSKNIQCAVCSNTKRFTLDFILKNLKIDNLLSFSLSNEDVTQPKPSPEIYLTALAKLNVSPDEALIIEDSPHGLISARGSKAQVQEVQNTKEVTLELIKKLVS